VLLAFAGAVGACLGSFLNVVIGRVPAGESVVSPGSRCPRCRAPIPKGAMLRCATCDTPARLDDGGDALLLDGIEMEVP